MLLLIHLFSFVFFATMAIHVELDGDMTTALFIDALRPLCDTRGKCKDICSDNTKNFVGANHQLSEFNDPVFQSKDHQN